MDTTVRVTATPVESPADRRRILTINGEIQRVVADADLLGAYMDGFRFNWEMCGGGSVNAGQCERAGAANALDQLSDLLKERAMDIRRSLQR